MNTSGERFLLKCELNHQHYTVVCLVYGTLDPEDRPVCHVLSVL